MHIIFLSRRDLEREIQTRNQMRNNAFEKSTIRSAQIFYLPNLLHNYSKPKIHCKI